MIEPNKKAPAYAEETVTINAPINAVYNLVADVESWPSWQSAVKSVKRTGDSFVWKAGGLTISSKFHTVRKNEFIGWTGKTWWIYAVHNWKFKETKNGTLVTVKESLSGLGAGLMEKSLREGMKKSLLELKKNAEIQKNI